MTSDRGKAESDFNKETRQGFLDEISGEQDELVENASPVLPHWTEPPTGEIPKVIAELSKDQPAWAKPSSSAPSPDLEGDWLASKQEPKAPLSPQKVSSEEYRPKDQLSGARKLEDSLPSHVGQDSSNSVRGNGGRRSRNRRIGTHAVAGVGDSSEKQAGIGRFAKLASSSGRPRSGLESGGSRNESTGTSSKPRAILTGIVLAGIVLAAISGGVTSTLALVVVTIFIATGEFYAVLRRASYRPAAIVGLIGSGFAVIAGYVKGYAGVADVVLLTVVFAMLWSLFGLTKSKHTINIALTTFGVLWIGVLGSFAALILRPRDFGASGLGLFLATLICTSASDVFAYFGGSRFGKRPLAPSISPTKTYEGLLIGALASMVSGALLAGRVHPLNTFTGLLLGFVVALATPLGDLCESMIKRDFQIKDVGGLLPGHGGVLDRIDGILFALPVAYYLFRFLHIG